MELQLKHLAPYLPFGIELKGNAYGWERDGTDTNKFKYPNPIGKVDMIRFIGEKSFSVYIKNRSYPFTHVKPLLYPLSCLTEEITLDGETFVPILELAKIAFPLVSDWRVRGETAVSRETIGHNFGFDKYGFFREHLTEPRHVDNQLALFQKLYEWHFDLHGLIDAGIAIDKRKHLNR